MLVCLLFSCSKKNTEEFYIKPEIAGLFSSTENYQILCWTIKAAEGYSSNSYRCQAGKRTVGWGFSNVKSIDNIQEADEIFHDLVNPLFETVTEGYPDLTYLQRAAITSLLYNSGDFKAIKNSKFSKSLRGGEIKLAVKQFKSWSKVRVSKGKFIVSKGLVNRRNYESKLLDGSFSREDFLRLKQTVSAIYVRNREV